MTDCTQTQSDRALNPTYRLSLRSLHCSKSWNWIKVFTIRQCILAQSSLFGFRIAMLFRLRVYISFLQSLWNSTILPQVETKRITWNMLDSLGLRLRQHSQSWIFLKNNFFWEEINESGGDFHRCQITSLLKTVLIRTFRYSMEWPTDATMCSEFISLQVHSTCFGRYTRPSSGVQV